MKKLRIARQILCLVLSVLLASACSNTNEAESTEETGFIDAVKVRAEIEAMGRQFSEEFKKKDSVALANLYASNGMLNSTKGHDNLVSAFNKMINYASENGTPHLLFKTNSVTTDDEYVIELGEAQWADAEGNVKREAGKYLVVWKQEDGNWKIYRDWGL